MTKQFKLLKSKFKHQYSDLKSEVIKEATVKIDKRISDEMIKITEERLKAESEVAYWKLKSENIANVCNRMQIEMNDLMTRVENLELNNSKRMVIVSGLQLTSKEKDLGALELMDFFNNILLAYVRIEEWYYLGAANPRSIVITFQSQEERRLVLNNKSLLKDFRTNQNGRIYINEFLPPTTNERRRQEKDVIQAACPEDPEEEFSVVYSKEGLTVQGQVYQKLVETPSPKQLIQIKPDELDRILKLPMTRGPVVTKEKSAFVAYVVNVSTIAQIQDYYIKIKIAQPNARHVVCSYNIDNKCEFMANDYQDDGEPGAGRVLLDFMRVNHLQKKAIFVARRFGGVKMGVERFQCYLEAARQAVMLDMPNKQLVAKEDSNRRKDRVTRPSAIVIGKMVEAVEV